MSCEEREKVVCVTGASGYIASWIVKLLLQRGYTVKASVRDPNDPKKTEHLMSLEGAKERLHLFKADLLEEGSFDSLVHGCQGVFHTASPVIFSVEDPQGELIDPALKGTLNVLKSCAKNPSIKRVVLTSSMATVSFNKRPLSPETVMDETWFSDLDYCEEIKNWYVVSKILAEEAAMKFAKENGIDLITMNPGFVIGPLLQPTLNLTVEMILNLVNGAKIAYPNLSYRSVDVRDVALAHILGFEIPSAHGRHCLVGHVNHYADIVTILRKLYPDLSVPQKCEDEKPLASAYRVSQEKAKSLGITYTPIEMTLRDTVESLKEKGFLGV